MSTRSLATVAVAALVLAGGALALPPPSAAAVRSPVEVTGNFAGDEREEVLAYVAGPAPDFMISFTNQGTSCGDLTWESFPLAVNGTYYPVAGNFDGDAYDEVVWHAPGPAQDYLMNFPSLTTTTVVPLTVNGDYVPVAGDFSGDGVDDVIWYAPGTGQDYLWDFEPGGTRTTVALTVNGSGYRPVAGSFGADATDDVVWYAPGTGTDYVWDFVAGTHDVLTGTVTANGTYQPFALDIFDQGARGEDIFWYAPGSATDHVWDFVDGAFTSAPDPVQGTYRPTAGDLLGDGHDDILWVVPSGAGFHLWDHFPTPEGGVDRCLYSAVGSTATDMTADSTSAGAVGVTGVAGSPGGAVERTGG